MPRPAVSATGHRGSIMTIWGVKIGLKLIGALALVIAILLLVTCGPAACNAIRSLTAQTKVNDAQHNAFTTSAGDAVSTQGNVASNASASEDITRSNEKAIRDANGADAQIDPAVRDAGFASLCKRPSFRNNPANRLRCPLAPVVAGASPHP